jgi:hypothetical protein
MHPLVGQVATFLLGVVVGVAANLVSSYLWESPVARLRQSRRERRAERQALEFDPKPLGYYKVNGWSPSRPLRPDNLRVEVTQHRPEWRWGSESVWRAHLEDTSALISGSCGYPVACSDVDSRESEPTQTFRVAISPCDYAEGAATSRLLEGDESTRRALADALDRDPIGFVATAPPSPLAINVAVVSKSGNFLALQRSATVWSARLLWTIGPNETMTLPRASTPGQRHEDFFELARRCLEEELGLLAGDYGKISISWFGYYAPLASPWVLGQVRTTLEEAEVNERITRCHSTEELAGWEWLPLNLETVRRITSGKPVGDYALVSPDEPERRWIVHAPHAVNELWRMKPALD